MPERLTSLHLARCLKPCWVAWEDLTMCAVGFESLKAP